MKSVKNSTYAHAVIFGMHRQTRRASFDEQSQYLTLKKKQAKIQRSKSVGAEPLIVLHSHVPHVYKQLFTT